MIGPNLAKNSSHAVTGALALGTIRSMRSANARGGATRPAPLPVLTRTGGTRGIGPDGVRQVQTLSGGSAAWLAVALVGMIVTFAFGLWLAQSAHPLPASPPYDPGIRPEASSAPG